MYLISLQLLLKMNYKLQSYLSDLPIYKKAQDIILLSRSISTYLNQDLCGLNPDGTEDAHIYFSGDIVQQSTNLAPAIANVELERHSENKYKHLEALDRLTFLLYKNCLRLEKANSNGKDFLPILRSELRKFKTMKRHWMMTF